MSDPGNAIIGTAGHIDHGKTALVQALTGQDTDRLPAEKERGISIELGFAAYEIGGVRFGVVDVPGHERFLRHMLAGAHGIDLVLLVVAADDGVMPQTEEHFDIVHLLGVERAIFVVTKVDLAPDRVPAVREEIDVLRWGTRFAAAPVVAVSSTTGAGLAELRSAIAREIASLPPRTARGYFRLPIDRAFTLHGHGLVVTGTAVAGAVATGDLLAIRPGELTARARSLQIHGTRVETARAGQRVAVNLAGLAAEQVHRGQWVTDPRVDLTTDRFDCRLEVRGGLRQPLKTFERVRVHVATAEVLGRVILLADRGELGSRESGFAQIALDEPVLVSVGDRFVLRTETATRTVGGGVVLQPFARRHRPDEAGVEEALERLARGDLAERMAALLDLLHEFAAPTDLLAQALGETAADVLAAARLARVIPLPDERRAEAWTTPAKWSRITELVGGALEHFHRVHPLEAGMEIESLRSRLKAPVPARLFRPIVERLAAEGVVVRDDALVRLPGHSVELGGERLDLAERVRRALRSGGLLPPDRRQLEAELDASAERIAEVWKVLERRGEVVRVAPDLAYDRAAWEEAKRRLVELLRERPEITVAEFRDRIAGSRKYALALLEHFDRTGLTLRVGDARKLRR